MLLTRFVAGFHKTLRGMGFRARLQAVIDSQIAPQAVELALFFLRQWPLNRDVGLRHSTSKVNWLCGSICQNIPA